MNQIKLHARLDPRASRDKRGVHIARLRIVALTDPRCPAQSRSRWMSVSYTSATACIGPAAAVLTVDPVSGVYLVFNNLKQFYT